LTKNKESVNLNNRFLMNKAMRLFLEDDVGVSSRIILDEIKSE